MDAQFLNQFENELAYLRQTGGEFANRFPTLAGRLGMDQFHCSDPFVERLLEGFAFLTARVHRRMDAEFPRFTTALLDAVFPLSTRPVPSAAIMRIEPALDEGSLVAGYTLPRGTRLLSAPAAGAQTGCRFDLTDDVQLWPLKIDQARFLSRDHSSPIPLPAAFQDPAIRSVLLLTLSMTIPAPLAALPLDRLRLHLRGGEIANLLTEYLVAHVQRIAIQTTNSQGQAEWLSDDQQAVTAVGFEGHQSLFPEDHRVFSGHRLLYEYFMLPEKFLFVNLQGLQPAISRAHTGSVQLAIGFDQVTSRLIGRVAAEHLSLFCAPAVNLFPRRTDRVWLDHAQHEQHLIADRSRVNDYEIWSIEELALHSTVSGQEVRCQPLYASLSNFESAKVDSLIYGAERRTRTVYDKANDPRAAYAGSDLFISLTDSGTTPRLEDFQQLSAKTYCTNRALPLLAPGDGWRDAFQLEAAGPIHKVTCLTGPTPPRFALASEQGEVAWRMINHLTPSYASLFDRAGDSCGLLRELLQLFCPTDNHAARRQIDGIQHIASSPVVRRVHSSGPLTYARGLEVELCFDETAFDGSVAFLLGSILEQFMARYVTLNSFTEFHLTTRQRGTIHCWAPRSGSISLI